MKTTIVMLSLALLATAAVVWSQEEVICRDAEMAFQTPDGGWRVNTKLTAPVAASLVNDDLNATITITYTDYDIYGFDVDYGFLKDKLEKNEKNNFKLTKPNYDRISLGDKKFSFGRAARLEFSTYDELGYHRTVVYAIANDTIVYFCSAESLEREWPRVEEDFEALVASLRFLP
jgi:hypothetical protein